MSSLVVGGVAIKVAVSSPRWTRSDGVDRSRSLDGTLRASQTGGAVRVWDFETPPVLASTDGETYKAALSTVASQLCSGDIIALPTMCSAELTDGVPTSVAGEPYVVLSFTLHEQQPAKVLLRYAPGDTITGESFSRSTTATYWDAAGGLQTAAINAKRDGHYGPYPGWGVRSLLLEDARTNQVLWSSDFSNAAWTKSTMTVTTGIPGIRDSASACTLTATGAGAYVFQALSAGSSIVRTNSIWIRRRTGTGAVQLYAPTDTAPLTLTLTASWQRFQVPGAASTSRVFDLLIQTSGDEVDVENAQLEDGSFASSEIQTTTVAVTKTASSYSLPHATPPQESTFYVKFVEGGTLASSRVVFAIDALADANPQLLLRSQGGFYQSYHHNGTASVVSTLGVAPAIGQTVELVMRLFGDGSVDTTQSINAAASTTSARSAANALPTAWSGLLVILNAAGTSSVGFTALQSFKVIAGSRSLQEMRAL